MINNVNIKKISFLLIALVIAIGSLTITAGAESGGSANFSVKANLPDNQRNLQKSYFDLSMTPNQKQTISVDVINYESNTIFVSVSANNAYTNQTGGIEYMQSDVKDESLLHGFSDIATLSSDRLEIPANGSVTVSVDLQMPKELYDGEIIGGLVFTKDIAAEEEGEKIAVVNRYSYNIGVVLSETQIKVQPDFEMISVYPELVDYRPAIIFELRNMKPIIADKGNISIEVFGSDSDMPLWKHEKAGIRVAPNSKMDYAMYLEGEELVPGKYIAKVHLESEELSWDFEDEFEILKEKADSINENTVVKPAQNTIPVWVWFLTALMLIVVILLVVVLLMLSRKNKKGD